LVPNTDHKENKYARYIGARYIGDSEQSKPSSLVMVVPPIIIHLGESIGHGTSGIVYPIVSATSDAIASTKIVSVDAGSMGTAKRQMENVVKDALVAKEVAIAEDTSNDGVKDIMREVELHRLCSANCPGIAKFVFSGMIHGESSGLMVVMEACRGDLWDALVAKCNLQHAPSTPGQIGQEAVAPNVLHSRRDELVSWTQSLCETVCHCHSLGVLHRDLNPWNVLLAISPETNGLRSLRLADFGLAVRLAEPSDILKGSESRDAAPLDASALESLYSAPELGGEYGLAADIFSLGMTLLAVWTTLEVDSEDSLISCIERVKESAKEAENSADNILHALQDGRDEQIRVLILHMVSAKPSDRPSSKEICQKIQQWISLREKNQSKTAEESHNLLKKLSAKSFCRCFFPKPTE
jgi:serine/threonine protein kinase